MAVLTTQYPSPTGSTLDFQAADVAGDEWASTGTEMLVVDNASTSDLTLTFQCYQECDTGGVLHHGSGVIAASARSYFPPCTAAFVNPATGHLHVTYSDATDVTVAVTSVAYGPAAVVVTSLAAASAVTPEEPTTELPPFPPPIPEEPPVELPPPIEFPPGGVPPE